MRSKGLLILLLCLLCTCVFYLMVGEPSSGPITSLSSAHQSDPATADLLTQSNPVHDRQVPLQPQSLSSHPGGRLVRQDDVDDEDSVLSQYLHELGFGPNGRIYPKDRWDNVTLPVFVTAVQSGQAELVAAFIHRLQETFPGYSLILNTMGLGEDEFETVNRSCTLNATACSLRIFDLDRYPSHISDLKLNAFRPILIQQVLDQTGAVVWMDPTLFVWSPDSLSRFRKAVSAAVSGPAVYSWTIEQPTSALTHPRMFRFFQTEKENFYFHRMIDPSCIILFNTQQVHEKLMQPWTRCALIPDCISPIGAQSTGCRYDKKPLYRYSGCHSYDMSALNVILGLIFNYSEKPYAGSEEDKFFTKFDADLVTNEADIADRSLEAEKRNTSNPASKLSFNRSGWRISS